MTVNGPLDELALAAVAASTGAWPYQPKGRQKTYVARGGKRFHLRTKNEEDDGEWFFGINERFWKAGEYFVLAYGGPNAMFVVPVHDPDGHAPIGVSAGLTSLNGSTMEGARWCRYRRSTVCSGP